MDFDAAVARVIAAEGALVDDPRDAGGLTKYGISARAYPLENIAALTEARARELYRRDYWGPAGCDAVPDALKFPLLDMAVNQGVKTAIRTLQAACGEYPDGVIGPHTLQALQSMPPERLLRRFCAARITRYTNASADQWARFGRGWMLRVARTMD